MAERFESNVIPAQVKVDWIQSHSALKLCGWWRIPPEVPRGLAILMLPGPLWTVPSQTHKQLQLIEVLALDTKWFMIGTTGYAQALLLAPAGHVYAREVRSEALALRHRLRIGVIVAVRTIWLIVDVNVIRNSILNRRKLRCARVRVEPHVLFDAKMSQRLWGIIRNTVRRCEHNNRRNIF